MKNFANINFRVSTSGLVLTYCNILAGKKAMFCCRQNSRQVCIMVLKVFVILYFPLFFYSTVSISDISLASTADVGLSLEENVRDYRKHALKLGETNTNLDGFLGLTSLKLSCFFMWCWTMDFCDLGLTIWTAEEVVGALCSCKFMTLCGDVSAAPFILDILSPYILGPKMKSHQCLKIHF